MLSKKTLCQLLKGDLSACQDTIAQIMCLPLDKYSYYGFVLAHCIKSKLSIIKKTDLNNFIKLSKLNVIEQFELVLYCKRMKFSSYMIKKIKNKVLLNLKNNHISIDIFDL
jgi:hypothetical protein